MIKAKRVYEPPDPSDGVRVLVDALWPRGLSKDEARLDHWLREVAPSAGLRKWFGHDPQRWEEFRRRYARELDAKPHVWQRLLELERQSGLTLLYAARDAERNNAVALKAYLERRAKASAG